jgi:CBS domain-containing protein
MIGRICIRDVDTAGPHETVDSISRRMHQHGVGCLVVVNPLEQPIGIVTDRDLVQRVMARGLDPSQVSIQEIMSTGLKTIQEERPIEAALGLMQEGRFRRVPIIDGHGRLAGLVTLDDILMSLASDFQQIGQLLEQETPRCVITA